MKIFELNNLAEDPDYQQVLTTYRQLLMDWMEDTNDLGRVDELSLMERWLVKGEQPRLDPLQLEVTDLGIELIEPKSDATIVYKQPQDSVWMVYSNPLPAEMSFTAKAERIGYTDSELLKYEGD